MPDKILHNVEEFRQIIFGNHRIHSMMIGNKYVLLHGFRKKTQKADKRHIETARRYFADYQKREQA
jgi:phage-related protein